MPQELDLYIDESQAANAAPLIGVKRKPAKISYVPLITVGDELTLRLWFYRGEFGATTLTNVTKTAAEVIFFAKASLATGSPALFGAAAVFAEITDERGDKGYEATFTLDTPEGRAAVAAGERIPIYCDVVTDAKTSQFTMGFRPDAYNGDPVPTPAVEALLEQVLDAAADAITAANDAAAASADKADKITGGTTGNLVKRDASGNIADSGLAVSTDGTLASNSDAKVATEKAVKTYADGKMAKVATATGEVMINAAGAAVNSGLKIAPAASAATPEQLMRGDDFRFVQRNDHRRFIRTNFATDASGSGAGAALNAMSAYLIGPAALTAGYAYIRPFGGAQSEELTWKLRPGQVENSTFDFSKRIELAGTSYLKNAQAGTTCWITLGKSEGVRGNPTVASIGIRIAGTGAVELIVHDGTTLTAVSSGVTPGYAAFDWQIVSHGTGVVDLYINDALVATTSAGPASFAYTVTSTYSEEIDCDGTQTVPPYLFVAAGTYLHTH